MAVVKDEAVFVIYRNGKPYEHVKKPVYLTKGAAKGQITQVAEEIARFDFENADYGHNYWYDLCRADRNELMEKVKLEFDVIEYGPKEDN